MKRFSSVSSKEYIVLLPVTIKRILICKNLEFFIRLKNAQPSITCISEIKMQAKGRDFFQFNILFLKTIYSNIFRKEKFVLRTIRVSTCFNKLITIFLLKFS